MHVYIVREMHSLQALAYPTSMLASKIGVSFSDRLAPTLASPTPTLASPMS